MEDLEGIFVKFYDPIYRYLMHLTRKDIQCSEDLTGETFRVLIEHRDELDFESELAIKSWLYRTARYKWMSYRKKRQPIPIEGLEDELIADDFDGIEEQKRYEEYIGKIERQLSGVELQIFHAIVVENLSYQVLSERLGLSEATLRVRWFRLKNGKLGELVERILGK